MNGLADKPSPGLPEAVRRLILPWWVARAGRLATALETALNGGETHVEVDGWPVPVEVVADRAEEAIQMVEYLEASLQ